MDKYRFSQGKYRSETGGVSQESCDDCHAKYWCAEGSTTPTQNVCDPGILTCRALKSVKDYYLPAQSKIRTSNVYDFSNYLACPHATILSPPGYYCGTGTDEQSRSVCSAGNYCPGGSSVPLSCPPGKYCADKLLHEPSGNCSGGYFCNGARLYFSLCLSCFLNQVSLL